MRNDYFNIATFITALYPTELFSAYFAGQSDSNRYHGINSAFWIIAVYNIFITMLYLFTCSSQLSYVLHIKFSQLHLIVMDLNHLEIFCHNTFFNHLFYILLYVTDLNFSFTINRYFIAVLLWTSAFHNAVLPYSLYLYLECYELEILFSFYDWGMSLSKFIWKWFICLKIYFKILKL